MHADQARQVKELSRMPTLQQLYTSIRREAEMGKSVFRIMMPKSENTERILNQLRLDGYQCEWGWAINTLDIVEIGW